MRKKYVFFTNSLGGFSGGPSYVRNKTKWLKQQGWDVVAFDSTSQIFEPIQFEILKEFEHNRFPELYFHPSWYSIRKREKIINFLILKIGDFNQCIIESNLLILSEWAELVAAQIKAQHIVYIITELGNVKILKEYNYLKFKVTHGGLYTINALRYKKLFSEFESISDDEAKMHCLTAMNGSSIEDTEDNSVPKNLNVDYVIGHFGRDKEYLPFFFQEVVSFANHHKEKKLALLCLGLSTINKYYDIFQCVNNLKVYVIPSRDPIPKSFFDKCDLIVGTAGCASMAYRHGSKVISMSVEDCKPLGFMGLTTQSSTFRNIDNDCETRTLSELLEDFYLHNRYENYLFKKAPEYVINYQSHLESVIPSDVYYSNVLELGRCHSLSDYINKYLIRCGGTILRTIIRNYTFTRKFVVKPIMQLRK